MSDTTSPESEGKMEHAMSGDARRPRHFIVRVGGFTAGAIAYTPTDALISSVEAFRQNLDAAFAAQPNGILLSEKNRRVTISIQETPR